VPTTATITTVSFYLRDYSRLGWVIKEEKEEPSAIAGARYFAGWMPFLAPNHQCQSTEEKYASVHMLDCHNTVVHNTAQSNSNKLCGRPPQYAPCRAS